MAEHSMCHPGRPLPQGHGQDGSPGLEAFHRAKSLGDRFSLRRSAEMLRSPAEQETGYSALLDGRTHASRGAVLGGLLVDPWTHFRLSPWSHMPSGPPQPDWSASLVQYGTLSTRSRAESEGTTRGPGPHLPSPRPPPPTPVFLLPHLV